MPFFLPLLLALQTPAPQAPQQPITAFPNSPKAPPPKVKDLQVPPAPTTPGPMPGQVQPLLNTPLNSEEAVRIALHFQPSLLSSVGAIRIQQGRTTQIGAAEKPQLAANLGYNKINSLSGPGTILEVPNAPIPLGMSASFQFATAATLRQLLYDFNETRNLVRQSEALESAARANLTVAQQDLVLAVLQAFYNYESAVQLVRVNEDNVNNRQKQLDLTTALFTSGIGRPSDVATAQASKSQAVLQLNQARDVAEQSRVQLLQQMGVDPLTPVVAADETAPEPASHDAHTLTDRAIHSRPEVVSAARGLVAAKYGLSAAKAVDLPVIFAQAGIGSAGVDFPLDNNTTSIGLGVSIPIFDGGIRTGAIQSAKGEVTTAESTLQTAVLQVRTDVSSAYMALLSAEQRVPIADNEVFNAAEALRIAEGRYAAGVGLFLDITNAQAVLLTAQTDQANAQNALSQARVQLARATGDLIKGF